MKEMKPIGKHGVMREYTNGEATIANFPYVAMILMGAGIIAFGFGLTPWALAGAVGYFAYGVVGVFWIMVFMCPYCAYFATRQCPCGYGMISARFARKGEQEAFAEKFKRHIPVIVLLWVIPAVCAVIVLFRSFTWWFFGLACVFFINSYVILPFVAMGHSCAECPQKDDCPWMSSRILALLRSVCLCGMRAKTTLIQEVGEPKANHPGE